MLTVTDKGIMTESLNDIINRLESKFKEIYGDDIDLSPDTPDGQIIAELASRGFPAPEKIEWLRDESIGLRHYVRTRRNGTPPPEDYGYVLRLAFAEPVSGPLCLGYSSHFGLGLFAPVPDGSTTRRSEA